MTETTKNIYNEVKKIIDPLYLVGGSIRDVLLGIEPKDYDFCTPHLPEEIEQKIRDVKRRPYLTGKRFGTLGVKIDGQLIEITTFRTEVYEKNNRKPKVEFVKDISTRNDIITVFSSRGTEVIPKIFQSSSELGIKIKSISLTQPTLDDVFISYTGRELRDDSDNFNKRREHAKMKRPRA